MKKEILGEGLLHSHDARDSAAAHDPQPEIRSLRTTSRWNPENFARQQVRGLVRQVFFSNAVRPVRQVVFSALEPETDVANLCQSVGESLARETAASVAVVGDFPRAVNPEAGRKETAANPSETMPLHKIATRLRGNLWLVPDGMRDADSSTSLNSYLGDVRREFDFSIVQGPVAGESDEATAMAQFADGIILVLSARHTRRATALKIKEALEAANVRMLGAVLSDRAFPIPDAIYRRL
jgi:hypothetical protein